MGICLDRDTDTIACIVGGLCEAAYGKVTVVPAEDVLKIALDDFLFPTVVQFSKKYLTKLDYKF